MPTRQTPRRMVFLTLITACCITGCTPTSPKNTTNKNTHFTFTLRDERTIREVDTTQIHITYAPWTGNTFCLWFPEVVDPLWAHWDPQVGRQEFERTPQDGLKWTFGPAPTPTIKAELTPRPHSIVLETTVLNNTSEEVHDINAQNCLHFPDAPDFACDDFSRLFVRVEGQWRSLASLKPTNPVPVYYRKGYPQQERRGYMAQFGQKTEVDHPLIILLSKDNTRCIATASENYACVFHNQGLEYLRCLHSHPDFVKVLKPGESALLRQTIYFVDGGIPECLAAFNADSYREP